MDGENVDLEGAERVYPPARPEELPLEVVPTQLSPDLRSDQRQAITWQDAPSGPMVFHDYANLFPVMDGDPYWALVDDVRANGVREPIVMLDGQILDGRNRYLASRECGRPYPTVEYDGDDALAYVVSLNLARRHLNESQRAAIAAKLATLPPGRPSGDNSANMRSLPSSAEAARIMNVSTRLVETARAVNQRGSPELIESVVAGKMTATAALKLLASPEDNEAGLAPNGPAVSKNCGSRISKGGRRGATKQNTLAFVADRCRDITKHALDHMGPDLAERCTDDPEFDSAIEACRAGRETITRVLEAYGGDRPEKDGTGHSPLGGVTSDPLFSGLDATPIDPHWGSE